jgi:hypothetical protein
VRTIAAAERIREQVRGAVRREAIEDANIVDDKSTIFGYHFDSDYPPVIADPSVGDEAYP